MMAELLVLGIFGGFAVIYLGITLMRNDDDDTYQWRNIFR
jgi:hypothetical protein